MTAPCYIFVTMRCWFEWRRRVLGTAALLGTLAGCAAQHDDALRLSKELGRARAETVAQRVQAAALESRVARIEQNAALITSARRAEPSALLSRLDRLIELNEKLLAERSNPESSCPDSSVDGATSLTDEQQLRALVERMRGSPGRPHGGLTREQEAALRVLLVPERKLDTENLWPASFY